MEDINKEASIEAITLKGSAINILLIVIKFLAAFFGASLAMLADAVHSLSDLITDIILLLAIRLGIKSKAHSRDKRKMQMVTTCNVVTGIFLIGAGLAVCGQGMQNTFCAIQGELLPRPGYIAFIAALLSILFKEWMYRFTIKEGKRQESIVLIGNAWHHRSDAISSVGTSIGIGGAIFLSEKWRILDPITAIIVSIFIIRLGIYMIVNSIKWYKGWKRSLVMEKELKEIASAEPDVKEVKNISLSNYGGRRFIRLTIVLPSKMTVEEANSHISAIGNTIKERFGNVTHTDIYVEPF